MKVTIVLEGAEAERFLVEHGQWGSRIGADLAADCEPWSVALSDDQITAEEGQ